MLLGHVKLFIIQHPKYSPFSAQPVFYVVLGIALARVQDLALGSVELHEIHSGLSRSRWVTSPPCSVSITPRSLVLSADVLRVL